jgi:hypothetical protein
MANPTNPFNWQMPTATDLVTDLPADFETFGQAVATSMADLLGGTTGQVLSKASNTDMDFTWVAADDTNAIQNAIVDAKGDLIAASAADTPARLAVGNNGETLVADSSTSTGLRYQGNFAAGKNKIINGDFYVNQRNLTSQTTDGAYGFDRWRMYASSGGTYSAQTFTPGTAPVAGYEGRNFARIVTAGQSGAGVYTSIDQPIEDVRTFAGQTITISFWAKAASGTPKVSLEVLQGFGSGGSGTVITNGSAVTLSTSWARYSATVAVPSISGATIGTNSNVDISFWVSAGTTFAARTNSIGIQSNTFDFWGVQVEAGSVATAFQTATGTIQGELAACQRYFYRFGGLINNEYFAIGTSVSATTAIGYASPKVSLRGTPTLSFTTASNYRVIEGTSQTTATSVNAEELSANNISFAFNASGFTIGRANRMNANNTTNGYIDISAEL